MALRGSTPCSITLYMYAHCPSSLLCHCDKMPTKTIWEGEGLVHLTAYSSHREAEVETPAETWRQELKQRAQWKAAD